MNQVINTRMRKHQHMRWTPRGAHFLDPVRCAMINGDLAAKLAVYRAHAAKVLELLHRPSDAFDSPMVLFDHIVQILA